MVLTDLIKEAVSQYDNKIFIVNRGIYRRKEYSYKQIYDNSLKLCQFFKKANINKKDKVIIFLPNSSDYVSILFSCALSGVIAVPIDINTNPEFVSLIYEKVGAKLVFCSIFRSPNKCNRYHIEKIDELYNKFQVKEIKNSINKNDIFEIVYTSGTTYEPKGVILTNNNLQKNIESVKMIIDFPMKNIKLLSILPLSHLFEQNIGLFVPMLFGSTIIYNFSRKSSSIIKSLKEENVEAIVTVPLFLNSMKEKIEAKIKEYPYININYINNYPLWLQKLLFYKIRKKLGKIKFFISGGAALDIETEKFWKALGYYVFQGYGLTETSPVLTCNNLKNYKEATVGKAIPDVKIKIINNEIIIQGENVFRGYYNNPEETKKVLKNNWFYTGDIGELDKEGFLKITGRKKNMILSPSGLNVYPEDIEKVINSFSYIKDSVVLGIENGKKLIAIILVKENTKLDLKKLLKDINSKLSSFQYLSSIYVWPEKDFPRTTTRKIIRRKIEESLLHLMKGKEIKKTSEDVLINLLSEVCEISGDKIKENEFLVNLSLDSLKRIELSIKIEDSFNIDFNEDDINEKTRVKDLRELIKNATTIEESSGINILNSKKLFPIRIVMQNLLNFISMPFYSLKVKGRENLINEQCIFIANHTSMLDTQCIFRALPINQRKKIFTAGAKDTFFVGWKHIVGFFARLTYNVFAFSRDTYIKQSLKDFGDIINKGHNILIYPEGTRSKTGKMNPFKNGIGLLALHMDVPVIPIKIIGLYDVLPKGKIFPNLLKKVGVIIGKPIKIDKTKSVIEITKILEQEMRRLE